MRFEPKSLIRIPNTKILEEIQRAVKENGGVVPTIMEFSRLANISIATIRDRFGNYAEAITRAGFVYVPPSAKYTVENVVADLRKTLEHTGGSRFSFNGYKQYGGVYALQTIRNCLGVHRWDEVMGVIGARAQPRIVQTKRSAHGERRREDLSDDDLLNEIGRLWREKGRRPTYTEFSKESVVDGDAYRLRFGSWPNAIERYCNKMGVRFQQRAGTHVTKAMLLEELRAVCGKRPGDPITYQLYRERGGTYSKGPFFFHFGNWINAVKAVGGVPGSERKYSIEQLFDEMQRLWEELGQQPTWHEMWIKGNISPKVYAKAFGSWKKSVSAFCNDRNSNPEQPSSDVATVDVSYDYHESIPVNQTTSTSDAAEIGLRVCPGTSSGIAKLSEHEAD